MTESELNAEFVEQQRAKLEELKGELQQMQQGMVEDEQERIEERQDSPLDTGDVSHELYTREMDLSVGEQAERRMGDIDRALEKIGEGTYGVCDVTGERIPKGRLEAVPEAIRTVEAQQRFERERRPT